MLISVARLPRLPGWLLTVVYRKQTPPYSALGEAGSTAESRAREQKNLEFLAVFVPGTDAMGLGLIAASLPSEPGLGL